MNVMISLFKQLGLDLGGLLGKFMVAHEQVTNDRVSPDLSIEIIEGMLEALEHPSSSDECSTRSTRIEGLITYLRFMKDFMGRELFFSSPTPSVFILGSKVLIMLDDHTLTAAERVLCQSALDREVTLAAAAATLGVSRHSLKRRCVKYGISLPARTSDVE